MQTKHKSADDSLKRAVAVAAHHQSMCNRSYYSDSEIACVLAAKAALELCYECEAIYVSYRKKFAAIKVAEPFTVARYSDLFLLESEWQQRGYTRAETAQGVIYRIPRQ